MKRAFLANETEWFVFFFSLIIFLGSIVVFFALSLVIAIPVFNISLQEIMAKIQDGANPENINLVKYFQVFQSFGIFIIPSIFIGFLLNKQPFRYLQFKKNINPQLVIILFFTIVFSNPLINLLAYINQEMELPSFLSKAEMWMREKEKVAEDITMAFLNVNTVPGLMFNIFMIGILPAMGEEMVFRGIIQKQLINITGNKHGGIIITAFIFSSIHFQFYGLLPRFVLGIFLGYLLVWTGNIWYPIIAHFINNSLAVIVYYIITVTGNNINLDNFGTTKETMLYGIASIFITIIFVVLFQKISNTQH